MAIVRQRLEEKQQRNVNNSSGSTIAAKQVWVKEMSFLI